MRILALDLGTKTGVASNYLWPHSVETWALAKAKEVTAWGKERLVRRCDPRVVRFYARLTTMTPVPELVVFEDVQFSTHTGQTQLWSSLRTAVWIAFSGKALLECVPVTSLKKFATGSGGAKKEQMQQAMFKQYPDTPRNLDDNAIDALWILKWAQQRLGRLSL